MPQFPLFYPLFEQGQFPWLLSGCWDKHHPQGKVEYKARSILEALYSMRDIKLSSHLLTRAEI
jgi:hypothetical protein